MLLSVPILDKETEHWQTWQDFDQNFDRAAANVASIQV